MKVIELNYKVGEKVRAWYFGVSHDDAEIIQVAKRRLRVRFWNCSGYIREAWRYPTHVHKFSGICPHCEYIRKWRKAAGRGRPLQSLGDLIA